MNEIKDFTNKNISLTAYEKVYVPDFVSDPDRKGQAPVCYDEFFNNEWQDETCRQGYVNRLLELEAIDKSTAQEVMNDFDGTENIEEVVYNRVVAENAQTEYDRFCAKELTKSKEEIFGDSYEIQFYKEIHGYLTNDKNPLDYEHNKALSQEGDKVISLLYERYLHDEYASVNTWDDITDFIDSYTRRYYSEIFNGGSELE